MRECPDGSIYLSSGLARREVERVLGPGGLQARQRQGVLPNSIAGHDLGRVNRKAGRLRRFQDVLHLLPGALEGQRISQTP